MFSSTATAVCRPRSPIHWPVTVPTLLFTVANPLCLATGNAMLDEMVTHMPAFMFITLPLIGMGCSADPQRPWRAGRSC